MKKVLSIMLVLAAFLAFSVLAYADDENFTVALTSSGEVEPGENVTITATATNVDAYGGLISIDFYVAIPSGLTYNSVAFNGTVDGWNIQANVVEGSLRVFAVNDSCTAAVETVSIDMVFTTTVEGTFTFNLTEAEGSASNGAYVTGTTASCDAVVKDNTPPAEPKNGVYFENGEYYYYQDDAVVPNAGLVLVEGSYYYVEGNGKCFRATVDNGQSAYRYTESTGDAIQTQLCAQKLIRDANMNDLLTPQDNKYYLFGEDAKMVDEDFGSWGKYGLRWIVDGKPSSESKAVVYNEKIYYIESGGSTASGRQYVSIKQANGLLSQGPSRPANGYYYFDEDGTPMNNKLVDWYGGYIRFLENGIPTGTTQFVHDNEGNLLLIESGGALASGWINVKASQLGGEDESYLGYHMWEKGHLFTGFTKYHNNASQTRYYVNGSISSAVVGVVEANGYIWYVEDMGVYKKGVDFTVTEADCNGILEPGTYYFNSSGHVVKKF